MAAECGVSKFVRRAGAVFVAEGLRGWDCGGVSLSPAFAEMTGRGLGDFDAFPEGDAVFDFGGGFERLGVIPDGVSVGLTVNF